MIFLLWVITYIVLGGVSIGLAHRFKFLETESSGYRDEYYMTLVLYLAIWPIVLVVRLAYFIARYLSKGTLS